MTPQLHKGARHFLVATAASGLAILACYGTTLVVGLLAAAGVAVGINEGIWVAAIVFFAVAAFVATLLGSHHRGQIGPAILSGIGVALVLWALFAAYDWRVELAGFICLALAAFWLRRPATNRAIGE